MGRSNGNTMIDRFDQLDPMENSLRELAEAERADLFRRTRVDARSLIRAARAFNNEPWVLRRVRWISIAAMLGMAATMSGWAFIARTGSPRLTSIPIGTMASATNGCDGSFSGCLTGPNGTLPSSCHGYDYDADGDIDLLDARTYQLNCNGTTR